MKPCVGSRCCQTINFKQVCQKFNLDSGKSLHYHSNNIYLERSFVNYCYKFIAYKFGVVSPPSDIVLKWSKDEWLFNTKVYRDTLEQDRIASLNILKDSNKNFERSIQDSSK